MPKDFAGRGSSNSQRKPRKNTRAKNSGQRRRATPTTRTLFHGPSFSFGILLGAAIVLTGLYAPEILQAQKSAPAAKNDSAGSPSPANTVEFEFPDLLQNSQVQAQPDNYPVPEEAANPTRTYLIQAASFRNAADADQLRAQLLLLNLPVAIQPSTVKDTTWYRIVVGPFDKKVEAQRALTKLREQRLAALLLEE